MLFCFGQGVPLSLEFTDSVSLAGPSPKGPAASTSPVLGLQAEATVASCYTGAGWGSELGSSVLYGKHFTGSAISLAPLATVPSGPEQAVQPFSSMLHL